jgi:hypothetical protein
MLKFLRVVLLLAPVGAAAAWFWAGRAEGPRVEIRQPERFIGQVSTLDVMVESPGGALSALDVSLEQARNPYKRQYGRRLPTACTS